MLRLLTVMVICLAATLAAACSDGAPVSSPSSTGGPGQALATVVPSETQWNPIYGYDPGTTTGVAVVDGVMSEISNRNLDALVARALTYTVGCTTTARAPSAYGCPPGVEFGTDITLVNAEFCSGSVAFPIAEARAIFRPLLDGYPRLWGLRELTPGNPSSKRPDAPLSRYVLFVVNNTDPPSAFTLILGEDGRIHSIGYGCHERPETAWAAWADGVSVLSPPAAPKPR